MREALRRLRPRGRRGAAITAALAVLLVTTAVLVALPLTSGGHEAKPRPVPAPWLSKVPGMRALTPVEAATWGTYVALGDSYSAGVGADTPGEQTSACHRTAQAYPQIVARDFTFAKGMAFWACSGARTGNVLRGQAGEPPQVSRLTAGTSLVTISIGGNDSGFANVMAGCVVRLPFTSGCRSQGLDVAKRLETLRGALTAVYGEIARRAPNARVLVIGYPRLFSPDGGSGTFNISGGDQQWLNQRGLVLDQLIRQVVQDADAKVAAARGRGSFEYVDSYTAFAGHEVGSSQPYVNGLDVSLMSLTVGTQSFHPTAGGYRALAWYVQQQVRRGPGRQILQYTLTR